MSLKNKLAAHALAAALLSGLAGPGAHSAGSMTEAVSEARRAGRNFLIYVIGNPTSGMMILPGETDVLEKAGSLRGEMNFAGARGQREPGSFVVRALGDIDSLHVSAARLEGRGKSISSEYIDIKAVKCWYRQGKPEAGEDPGERYLKPDLLLNDASLVRVDYDTRENYLRIKSGDGEEYILTSDPDEPAPGFHRVKDSPELLPVAVPAGRNKQFWVTVKIPEDAEPGVYEGTLIINAGDDGEGRIGMRLRVLPFEIDEPYYTSSIYFTDRIGEGAHEVDEDVFLKRLENLAAHGVTSPTVYQNLGRNIDRERTGRVLEMMQEAGMNTGRLYYLGNMDWWRRWFDDSTPGTLQAIVNEAEEFMDFAREYGVEEVYFYGRDEARGEMLTRQRPVWEAVREAGGKIFVAGYRGSNYELMGDVQDLAVIAGALYREEAEKWHSAGHRIWSYANPQAGLSSPEPYRRNFGLMLWRYNYDGAANWAYYHPNLPWNDFANRNWSFVYPTTDGVVDTIAWAGYREGVDDVRYVTTLSRAIERGRNSRSRRTREAASAAEIYLDSLEVETRNLDTVRLEMTGHLLKLQDVLRRP